MARRGFYLSSSLHRQSYGQNSYGVVTIKFPPYPTGKPIAGAPTNIAGIKSESTMKIVDLSKLSMEEALRVHLRMSKNKLDRWSEGSWIFRLMLQGQDQKNIGRLRDLGKFSQILSIRMEVDSSVQDARNNFGILENTYEGNNYVQSFKLMRVPAGSGTIPNTGEFPSQQFLLELGPSRLGLKGTDGIDWPLGDGLMHSCAKETWPHTSSKEQCNEVQIVNVVDTGGLRHSYALVNVRDKVGSLIGSGNVVEAAGNNPAMEDVFSLEQLTTVIEESDCKEDSDVDMGGVTAFQMQGEFPENMSGGDASLLVDHV
ncbi:hypothetical protein MA16_Dca018835 [Dendrobium catenatum]|uniref:Uncharacterized protein n=1 Tax=Dendrobium catenatum TaxID=906689 RepID=A0A2I0WVU1_9ASPA|nr:hypothetical protein MA16_Dca018835 [Dendrobium catenatum]